MNDKEALETIGRLIKEGRQEHGESQAALAKRAGLNVKTLWSAEAGARLTQDTNQYKLEVALGWRIGSIAEIWAERAHLTPGQLTTADMRQGAGESSWSDLDKEAQGPLTKAIHLTDEELLAELSYRFRNYKNLTSGGNAAV